MYLILVQSKTNRKGYGCTKILMVVLLTELKGDNVHQVALNLNIVLFLFNTMKVCKRKKRTSSEMKKRTSSEIRTDNYDLINYEAYCQ